MSTLSWSSAPLGHTPLQAAVQSHNTVVKGLRKQDSLPEKMELLQMKNIYLECIKILLLMGASAGTKVGSRPRKGLSSPSGWSWATRFLTTCLVCLQDLKSGRTSIHIACEEANVEVLSVFLHQPSSPSFINTAVSGLDLIIHVGRQPKRLCH